MEELIGLGLLGTMFSAMLVVLVLVLTGSLEGCEDPRGPAFWEVRR